MISPGKSYSVAAANCLPEPTMNDNHALTTIWLS